MNELTCSAYEAAPADWDDYVRAHPDAGVFHLAQAVSIGARVFGLRTHFVVARDGNGRLVGALPLVEQLLIPRVRTLVSLPFCTLGGPLAEDDRALEALVSATEQLAGQRRARRVVLRLARPAPGIPYTESLDKVAMVLELPADRDELGKRLGSKLRSQVKRAERASPEVRIGRQELLDDFYRVFCSVMRDLGTPVYPRRFFDAVLDALGEAATVVVIRVNGQAVSGAVTTRWRDVMEVPWAGTLHAMNPNSINMRLYWELLGAAIDAGCRRFDFGRSSRDSGTQRFKAQWGAQPVQLHWLTHDRRGGRSAEVPARGPSLFDSASRTWSRLPLWLTNALGPGISPRLPW